MPEFKAIGPANIIVANAATTNTIDDCFLLIVVIVSISKCKLYVYL